MPFAGLARWRVGYPQPASIPKVTITSPLSPAIYTTNPASIFLTGLAISGYTNIYSADFYINGVEVGTPQTTCYDDTNAFAFTNEWDNPSPGIYLVEAVAEDGGHLIGQSTPIIISIKDTNNTITAIDDQYTILSDSPAMTLQVLTNDSPSSGLKISQIISTGSALGTVAIGRGGTYLTYTPFPNVYGRDIFYYAVTNASGAVDSASVTVNIHPVPLVEITEPNKNTLQAGVSNGVLSLTISGDSFEYGGSITNVSLYVNKNLFGQTTNSSFGFGWTNANPGIYTFIAVAADQDGLTSASSPVTILAYTTTNEVTAEISNLGVPVDNSAILPPGTLPFIGKGLYDLQGLARATTDSTNIPVAYQVMLYHPDAYDTPVANVTPQADANGLHEGSSTNDLGSLDFTGMVNGIYDIVLTVYGGGAQASVTNRFILDSQLKVGQFSFSEQDMVIPVNGIPLTVTRTYNSINTASNDFGYGWSLAINAMDVQLDETREDIQIGGSSANFNVDDEGSDSIPRTVSVRSGGGWDVTLTLPNGQQTTFTASLSGNQLVWNAPSWVHAKLTPLDPNMTTIISTLPPLAPFWGGSDLSYGNAPLENQDFSGWILTTYPDNTQYYIRRGEGDDVDFYGSRYRYSANYARVYGPPKLTTIVEHSGDTIQISDSGISHYNPSNILTRAILFKRDSQGRITAIFDPNAGPNGLPSVQYVYNQDTGNLIQVLKLVDRNTGTYTTNKYDYNNADFPHYITSIENGDGTTVAENFYDDNGKLTAVQDADGNLTQFVHNTTNDMEVVIDRLGHTNIYVYDPFGNVTAQTNALGQVKTMAYDANNNKTNEVAYLNGLPYATNSYSYDPNNLLLMSTDPLGHINSFTYDGFGDVLTSTDARENATVNTYDGSCNLTNTSDVLGNPMVNFYDGNSLLLGSKDAIGTIETNYYDSSENLIATATLDVSGAIISTNSSTYDDNGNRLTSTVWRRVNGSWTGATTTYVLDAQNRIVQTIDPDGGTNTVIFNAIGKQTATIDKLGHTNSYAYDDQGRTIQTTYPDGTTETSAYDAAGNRISSTDRGWRTNNYVFDALNRPIQTIYPDNTTNITVYDDVGRVRFSVDARGTTNAFGFDLAGRRVAVTNAWGTSVATVSLYGFDANGNQITFTDANNHTTTNVFDALNRQVQVQFPDGTKTSTGYDAAGRRVAETNQDGIVTLFGNDGGGKLISVTNAFGKPEQMVTSYQYDEAGNQTAQIDALKRTNTFQYDSLGRRIKHILPGNQFETFGYDLVGNLICYTNFNGIIITNQFDAMNQLTNCEGLVPTATKSASPTLQPANG